MRKTESEKEKVRGMDMPDKKLVLAGVVLFGSIWGMIECVLGSIKLPDNMSFLPMGAILAGLFGLGIMAYSRRVFGVPFMQLGIAAVAGVVRLWAPIGTCVICSALAIVAEGLVFELIFNRPLFDITRGSKSPLRDPASLAMVGVVSGYAIYVTGYMFTQLFTPIVAPPHVFNPSSFVAVLPLILGRGFFAALLGGVSLPMAVSVRQLHIDVASIRRSLYFPLTACISGLCWAMVILLV